MDIHAFNWVDWVIFGVMVLSTLVGLFRGFVRESLSLVVWAVAFVVSFKLATPLSDHYLASHITHNGLRYGMAFAGIFVVILIVGGLVNYFVATLVKKTGLGGTDRVLGFAFGILRGAVIIAVVLMFINITPAKSQAWVASSKLLPRFQWLATKIHDILPPSVQEHLKPQALMGDDNDTTLDSTVTPGATPLGTVMPTITPAAPDNATAEPTPDNSNQ